MQLTPNSRGSAGIVALAVAAAVLLGCLWLAFGQRPPAGSTGGKTSAPRGPAADALVRDADDLLSRLSNANGASLPSDLRFSRDRSPGPVRPELPAVRDLRSEMDGGAILLRWDTGVSPAAGFLVERIGEDGKAIREERLPADARTFRDDTLDAVAGARTYRVTALGVDGLAAGAEQRAVKYRVEPSLAYLGANSDRGARFLVSVGTHPAQEFTVAPGAEIGEARPGMDWRTGYRFAGLRATRQVVTREVDVPGFASDGKLARRPETGEVLTEKRAVPVPVVSEGVVVLPPDTPDVERWLPRSKD